MDYPLNVVFIYLLSHFQVIDWQRSLNIPHSENISPGARDLIHRLLCEPEHRLGRHVDELKQHMFFDAITWSSDPRDYPAPYIPEIKDATDTSNFDPVQPVSHGIGSVDDLSHQTNPAFYEFTFRRFELMPAHISSRCGDDASTPPSAGDTDVSDHNNSQQPAHSAPSSSKVDHRPLNTTDNRVSAQPPRSSRRTATSSLLYQQEPVVAAQTQALAYGPSYSLPVSYYPDYPTRSSIAVIHENSPVLQTRLQPQTCHPPSFSPPLCPDSALATYV